MNDFAGDEASIMFPNPPFVIAFDTARLSLFISKVIVINSFNLDSIYSRNSKIMVNH